MAYNKWHQNHQFYNHHIIINKFADENFSIAKLDQNGCAYRLRLH